MLAINLEKPGNLKYSGNSLNLKPQPFCGPFSGTTRVSRCQKRTSRLYGGREDLTEADILIIRLGATPSRLTSAYLHHPPIFFTGRMPFLPPNQQHQNVNVS